MSLVDVRNYVMAIILRLYYDYRGIKMRMCYERQAVWNSEDIIMTKIWIV